MVLDVVELFEGERGNEWGVDMPVPEGVRVNLGVVYGTGGGREQITDLFLPPDGAFEGPRPAVVYLHGGGWQAGSRTQFYRHAALLAARGVIGSCCEYRLSGEATFPAAAEDSKCAVRALRAWADELGVDRDRIGVAGSSAGGHLAALVATTAGVEELEGAGGHQGERSDVRVGALFNPVTDMVDFAAGDEPHPAVEPFMGGLLAEREEAHHLASPIEFVGPDTPPCILFHGTGDITVPVDQSTRFAEALRAAGVEVEVHLTDGVGHGFANSPEHFETTHQAMERFVLRRL